MEDSQNASDKQEDDSKSVNDRAFAMVPRFLADKLKAKQPIEPISYENITVLIADIASFTSITYVL